MGIKQSKIFPVDDIECLICFENIDFDLDKYYRCKICNVYVHNNCYNNYQQTNLNNERSIYINKCFNCQNFGELQNNLKKI